MTRHDLFDDPAVPGLSHADDVVEDDEERSLVASVAGLSLHDLEQALPIRYHPGAGIGWHRDRPQFDRVVGLPLGAPATLGLRRRHVAGAFERASMRLEPRSAYVLDGEVRRGWERGIVAIAEPRWSITLRSLSGLGRRLVG